MAVPVLVQSRNQPSSSAAPANFTANYTSNTTAGNLLVAVTGFALSGAITAPAPTGWTLVNQTAGSAGNAIAGRIYYQANTAGGFTAVTFATLAGVNGLSVCLFEFSNMDLVSASVHDDSSSAFQFTASTTTPGSLLSEAPLFGNQVWVGGLIALTGQTLTAANLPASGTGAWTAGPSGSSTLGATNVQVQSFYVFQGSQFPSGGLYSVQGTLGGATAGGATMCAFRSNTAFGPLVASSISGSYGLVSGTSPAGVGG